MTDAPILIAKDLTKSYGSQVALEKMNLELPKGKIVGLLGPNGSGKTTFIKLVAGLLTPTSGSVTVMGEPIGEKTKACVSYLPERNSLPLSATPEALIRLFSDFFPDFDEVRCRKMLSDLALPMTKPIRTFSKGMKEKVQLIMVMSRRAKIYILDEPIAGVDPAARDYIMETIFKNRDPESTLLISTHLIQDIENVLDEFVFLRQGVAVRYDSVENIRAEGTTLDALFREVFKWASC